MRNVSAIKCENFVYAKKSSFTCMVTYNDGNKKNSAKQFENVDMVRINTDVNVDNGMFFRNGKISMEFSPETRILCENHKSYSDESKIDISCFKQDK